MCVCHVTIQDSRKYTMKRYHNIATVVSGFGRRGEREGVGRLWGGVGWGWGGGAKKGAGGEGIGEFRAILV